MYNIVTRRESINRVASGFNGTPYGVFEAESLQVPPRLEPPELGLVRCVSWLYVLYYEVGKVGISFLVEKFHPYGVDIDTSGASHYRTVGYLRTCLQHHLSPRKPHDQRIQEACEDWLRKQCGSRTPGTDDQWKKCLAGLLTEADRFLDIILEVIRCIEGDESQELIVREWQLRIRRYHPPEQFDRLIAEVASDMGRDSIDPVRLRQRFYDKWSEKLRLLQPDVEFETAARKLVEQALLSATIPVLPITGKDIIELLGIPPGPIVGQMLERARRLYIEEPCSREALLERLRNLV